MHAHESCMHVAVRVLHSSAFIFLMSPVHGYNPQYYSYRKISNKSIENSYRKISNKSGSSFIAGYLI